MSASPLSEWTPGNLIDNSTTLAPVFSSLGFGSMDQNSWKNITELFGKRGCHSVGELSTWSDGEVLSLLAALDGAQKLTKHKRTYMNMLCATLGLTFEMGLADAASHCAAGQGADWMSNCTKVRPKEDFNVLSYVPDGRIFERLPRKGTKKYLELQEEQLAGDLVWMQDGCANPARAWIW